MTFPLQLEEISSEEAKKRGYTLITFAINRGLYADAKMIRGYESDMAGKDAVWVTASPERVFLARLSREVRV